MTALAYMAAGGHGCISVTANVAPAACAELMESALKRDYARALQMQDRLTSLHAAIFLEPGVCGAKYALSMLGRARNEMRLPLTPIGDAPAFSAHSAGHSGRDPQWRARIPQR